MLRKLLFWLLKRECGDRGIVFVNVKDGYIMDFEIESMKIDIENHSNYDKIFTEQTVKMDATLKGLWINAAAK